MRNCTASIEMLIELTMMPVMMVMVKKMNMLLFLMLLTTMASMLTATNQEYVNAVTYWNHCETLVDGTAERERERMELAASMNAPVEMQQERGTLMKFS